MKELKQRVIQRYLNQHEGFHGDCWAACISSITGIPINEIPDVNDPQYKEWSVYWLAVWRFLQDRGFNLYCESVAKYKVDGTYCIASGKSPRGDFLHAVVWKDGIAHDPHPSNKGILSIDHFEIIEPAY